MKTSFTTNGKKISIPTWLIIIFMSGYLAAMITCFTTIVVYTIYKVTYEKNHFDNVGTSKFSDLPGSGNGSGH